MSKILLFFGVSSLVLGMPIQQTTPSSSEVTIPLADIINGSKPFSDYPPVPSIPKSALNVYMLKDVVEWARKLGLAIGVEERRLFLDVLYYLDSLPTKVEALYGGIDFIVKVKHWQTVADLPTPLGITYQYPEFAKKWKKEVPIYFQALHYSFWQAVGVDVASTSSTQSPSQSTQFPGISTLLPNNFNSTQSTPIEKPSSVWLKMLAEILDKLFLEEPSPRVVNNKKLGKLLYDGSKISNWGRLTPTNQNDYFKNLAGNLVKNIVVEGEDDKPLPEYLVFKDFTNALINGVSQVLDPTIEDTLFKKQKVKASNSITLEVSDLLEKNFKDHQINTLQDAEQISKKLLDIVYKEELKDPQGSS